MNEGWRGSSVDLTTPLCDSAHTDTSDVGTKRSDTHSPGGRREEGGPYEGKVVAWVEAVPASTEDVCEGGLLPANAVVAQPPQPVGRLDVP